MRFDAASSAFCSKLRTTLSKFARGSTVSISLRGRSGFFRVLTALLEEAPGGGRRSASWAAASRRRRDGGAVASRDCKTPSAVAPASAAPHAASAARRRSSAVWSAPRPYHNAAPPAPRRRAQLSRACAPRRPRRPSSRRGSAPTGPPPLSVWLLVPRFLAASNCALNLSSRRPSPARLRRRPRPPHGRSVFRVSRASSAERLVASSTPAPRKAAAQGPRDVRWSPHVAARSALPSNSDAARASSSSILDSEGLPLQLQFFPRVGAELFQGRLDARVARSRPSSVASCSSGSSNLSSAASSMSSSVASALSPKVARRPWPPPGPWSNCLAWRAAVFQGAPRRRRRRHCSLRASLFYATRPASACLRGRLRQQRLSKAGLLDA